MNLLASSVAEERGGEKGDRSIAGIVIHLGLENKVINWAAMMIDDQLEDKNEATPLKATRSMTSPVLYQRAQFSMPMAFVSKDARL